MPRTARSYSPDSSIETLCIDIAKRLKEAGVAETVIIESVWGCTRGGGKTFVAARETFRRDVAAAHNEQITENAAPARVTCRRKNVD